MRFNVKYSTEKTISLKIDYATYETISSKKIKR